MSLSLLCVGERGEEFPLSLESLERAGYRLEVHRAQGADEARAAVAEKHFDLAICGSRLAAWDARPVLVQLNGVAPALPVIVVRPGVDEDGRAAFMRAGAFAVVRDPAELPSAVRRGLARAEGLRGKGPAETLEAGSRILLVDDQDAVLRVAGRLLERAGYGVMGFRSAERALGHFREDPESFDLVITDYSLGRQSGLVLAAQLRTLRPGLPILLMTGYGECLDSESGDEGSVSGVVQKPFRGYELLEAVRRALGAGATERSEGRERDNLRERMPRP